MISRSDIVLLTGGAGFIGSNLLRTLVGKNITVHLLLRPSSDTWRIKDLLKNRLVITHNCDLLDKKQLSRIIHAINPTVIYHFAAEGTYHGQNHIETILSTNVIGTYNLLEASNQVSYRLFVNSGSSSEYGFCQKPMTENQILKPNSYYAIGKAAQTHLAQFTAELHNRPIVTIRFFSVYGPFESPQKLLPTLFSKTITKQPLVMASKHSAHDFVYIDDVVAGLLQVAQLTSSGGSVLNFGTGTQTTLEDVISILASITQVQSLTQWENMHDYRWDSPFWVADTEKVKSLLKWQPRSFKKGLASYWKWFLKNSHHYA